MQAKQRLTMFNAMDSRPPPPPAPSHTTMRLSQGPLVKPVHWSCNTMFKAHVGILCPMPCPNPGFHLFLAPRP